MPATTLIGGGRDAARVAPLLRPFLDRCAGGPVACVVADEGEGIDEDRWRGLLAGADVRLVVVAEDRPLAVADVDGCTGTFVAGGWTPLYARLVVPAAAALASLPYAGFSAGAALAADHAIVGGHRDGVLALCPPDAGEELEELTIVPGLGRVPFAVDVHAAQWGTLGRAIHAVRTARAPEAWALDEDTAIDLDGPAPRVLGDGAAHHVTPDGAGVMVTARRAS